MAQAVPKGYFAKNIDAVGYHDLNGKPAFKLALQEKNRRWYLYVAHLWHRGWSALDVTDPAAPQYCAYVPGPENTWTIQIQVADGKMIAGLERIAPGWGGDLNGAQRLNGLSDMTRSFPRVSSTRENILTGPKC